MTDPIDRRSDDQLFEELGYAIFEKDAGGTLARPPKPSELITRAKTWMTEQNDAIASLVCVPSVRAIVEGKPTGREKLITTISNVLSAHYVGLPLATLAEIVLRSGISQYCASKWASVT
ncbi:MULTISPECIES: hypothetical protein [unclassified Bradyrhizobium]|uniref:hypothetical protein n=1 Tax=unclassified Bradyrhizobium TaxID=2631580 RepID=UPI002916E77D|nr:MULTISPECIES: hypothetical protein [unclassified Bradyrhizobium]